MPVIICHNSFVAVLPQGGQGGGVTRVSPHQSHQTEVARRAPSAVDYERIPGLQVSRAEDWLCQLCHFCLCEYFVNLV